MGAQPGKPTNDPVSYFALGKQTAKGTVASTFYFLKHMDGTGFEVEKEINRDKEGGDGQQTGLSYVSMVKADGALAANARPEIIGRLAVAALGADSVGTASVPTIARHTITYVASLPYYTVDQRFSDEIEQAQDCVMTGFTLEGEAGRPLKVSANFVSGGTVFQRDTASSLTAVRDYGKPFMFPGGSYTFDSAASYAADVTKFRIEVQRQVDDGIQTTGLGRDDVIPLAADVQVDATIKYTSRGFYQKVTYNGGSVAVSDLPTGSLDISVPQMVYLNASLSASGLLRAFTGLLEWSDAKVNKLDPDGKTVYLDVVGNTVTHPGGSSPLTVVVDTPTLTAY